MEWGDSLATDRVIAGGGGNITSGSPMTPGLGGHHHHASQNQLQGGADVGVVGPNAFVTHGGYGNETGQRRMIATAGVSQYAGSRGVDGSAGTSGAGYFHDQLTAHGQSVVGTTMGHFVGVETAGAGAYATAGVVTGGMVQGGGGRTVGPMVASPNAASPPGVPGMGGGNAYGHSAGTPTHVASYLQQQGSPSGMQRMNDLSGMQTSVVGTAGSLVAQQQQQQMVSEHRRAQLPMHSDFSSGASRSPFSAAVSLPSSSPCLVDASAASGQIASCSKPSDMVMNNDGLKVANQMPVISQQQQTRASQMYGLQGSAPMEVPLESEFSFPGVDHSANDSVQQQQQQHQPQQQQQQSHSLSLDGNGGPGQVSRSDPPNERITRSSTASNRAAARLAATEASGDAEALDEVLKAEPLDANDLHSVLDGKLLSETGGAKINSMLSQSVGGVNDGQLTPAMVLPQSSDQPRKRSVKHVRFVEPNEENSFDGMRQSRGNVVSPHPLGLGHRNDDDGDEDEEEEEEEEDGMDGLTLMQNLPPVESLLVEMEEPLDEEDNDDEEVEMEDDDDNGGRRRMSGRRRGGQNISMHRPPRSKHSESIELELEPLLPEIEMGEGDGTGTEKGDDNRIAPVAHVCRVCLCDEKPAGEDGEVRSMESLYCTVVPEYQSRNLYSILVAVCHPLHLGSNAGMPDRICGPCKTKLLAAYELYDMCLRNDEMLRRKYQEKLLLASSAAGGGGEMRRIKKEKLDNNGVDGLGDDDEDDFFRGGISKRGSMRMNDADDTYLYDRQYPLHAASTASRSSNMAALQSRFHQQQQPHGKWGKYQRHQSQLSNQMRIHQVANGPEALRQLHDGRMKQSAGGQAARSAANYDYNSFHRVLPNGSHQCTKCMREFKYHSYYKNHYISQHDPSKPFKCRKCHYTFLTERWLIVHMRTHIAAGDMMSINNSGQGAMGPDSGAADSFDSSMDGSVDRRKGARGFDCYYCDMTFPAIALQKRHMLSAHADKHRGLECPICQCRFANQSSFLLHLQEHKDQKRLRNSSSKPEDGGKAEDGVGGMQIKREYNCTVCTVTFAREVLLNEHMQEQHPDAFLAMHTELAFMCGVCLAEFNDRTALESHTSSSHTEAELAEAATKEKSEAREASEAPEAPEAGESGSQNDVKQAEEKVNDEPNVEGDANREASEEETKGTEKAPEGCSLVYKCKLCQSRFVTKSSLATHLETHVAAMKRTAGKRPYSETVDNDGGDGADGAIDEEDYSGDEDDEDDEYAVGGEKRPKRNKTQEDDDDTTEEMPIDPDEISFNPDTGEQMFTCQVCGKVINTVSQFRRHKRVHSPKGRPFECHICFYRFAMKYSYTAHMLRHELGCNPTQPTTYRCSKCSETFTRRKLLSQHIAAMHGRWSDAGSIMYGGSMGTSGMSGRASLGQLGSSTAMASMGGSGRGTHTCPICSESFTRESVLNGHMKTHNLEAAQMQNSEVCYLCRVCSNEFESRELYEAHAAEAHPGTKMDMVESGVASDELVKLEDSMDTSAAAVDDGSIKNQIKGENAEEEEGGALGEGDEDEEDQKSSANNGGFTLIFKCKLCSGRFLKKKSLDWHLQTHRSIAKQGDGVAILPDLGPDAIADQPKMSKCTVCGQIFDNEILFHEHMRSHQRGPRPVHMGYMTQSPPTRRRRTGGRAIIQCELCKKTFMYRSQLHQHTMLHHQPGKPYECKICHYSFVHKLNLKRHELTHLREPPRPQENAMSSSMLDQDNDQDDQLDNSHLLQPLVLMDGPEDETNGNGRGGGATGLDGEGDQSGSALDDRSNLADDGTGSSRTWTQKKFKCVVCSLVFTRQNELVVHLQTHIERINEAKSRTAATALTSADSGISPTDRQCKLCHKVFKFSCQLKQHHLLHHAREKPFECRTCHYRFEFKGHLVRHRANHHPNEAKEDHGADMSMTSPYLTSTPVRGASGRGGSAYGEGSSQANSVPKYGGLVTDDVIIAPTTSSPRSESGSAGVPTHQCPMCSLKFIKARSLAMHMRIHLGGRKLRRVIPASTAAPSPPGEAQPGTPTGADKLVCRFCSGSFPTAHELKTHMMTHIGSEAMDLEVPFGISAFNMLHENMFNDSMGGEGGSSGGPLGAEDHSSMGGEGGSNSRAEGGSTDGDYQQDDGEDGSGGDPLFDGSNLELEDDDDGDNDDDVTDTNDGDGGAGEDDDEEDEGEQSSASTMASFQRHMNLMATHRSRLAATAALSARLQATPSASSSQSSSSAKGKIVCELCKKEFLYPCNLNQHKQLHHSKDKPHECRICHYRFEYVGHLQRHIRQQHEKMAEELLAPAEPQTFDCNFCGESFDSKPLLTAHVHTMHRGEKPFQCDKCPATFSYKKSYETHREEHYLKASNGAFKCSFCKKTFNSAQKVDNHVECCRICVTESEGKHFMDEIMEGDKCLSLNMMLESMFPMLDGLAGKATPNNPHLPTKACESCQQKILVAYELYMLLLESEDRFQRYQEEQSCLEDEGVKTDQSCAPYEVLIECTFDDGDTAFSVEEEQPVLEPENICPQIEEAPPEQSLDEGGGLRKRGRRRTRPPQETEVEKKQPKRRVKQERLDTSSREEEMDTTREENMEQLDESSVEQSMKPAAKKRGRKPKVKSESVSVPEGRKERKKTAAIKEEAGEDSSDQAGELQSKVDVYHCQLCEGHTYGSPMELTVHLKAFHADQIRTCDKCPKVFMTEAAYQHHQYCHATLRSYFCMFCDKGFQTENLLKSHTRSHTEVAEFLCSLCGKKFNNKSNLRQHLVRHTGVKPWACTQCPSRFCTKGALNLHQRTHSKLRPFSCDICGSQFHTRYSLIKHQLIHTGERPYGCDLCPMRFVSTYHVKRHMLTHTGEKPFKCTYCERSFAQSNDMVKHMKTHVGENPYQCDRCEASFRLLTDLRNHYKETCTPVDKGAGSSADEAKAIRFTSTNILKMRYEKEMGQYSERYDESCGNRKTDADYRMHEPLDENGSQSLQIVLEKLFPAVFNEEQVQHDYSQNWPMVVCQECKRKVQEAYELYEICLDSQDKLHKRSMKEIIHVDNAIVPVDCTIDEQAQEFLECDLIPETEMEPAEPLAAPTRRTAKSRKSEPVKVTRTKKTLTSTKVTEIKQEFEQSDEEPEDALINDEDDEFPEESNNTEPEWKPETTGGRGRKPRASRAKAEKKLPEEKKKRERKVKPKVEPGLEDPLESKTELYRCQLCSGPTYASPIELTEHLKTEHANQIRPCDKCPKVFVSEQTFQHHQYCHATGRSFFCDFCDKGFQTDVLLTSHVKSHTRGPKFLCSCCGKGFTSKSSLQKHMTFHTDSKSWPCSLCPCRFNTKACLNVHMRTHTKTKIYTCPICGSQFNKHYSMVKHQIIHTVWKVDHCINERSDHDRSLSLHCMLEKLFPATFNATQQMHDRSMSWPSKICQDCRRNVLQAYALYEQCGQSAERLERLLNQQEETTIGDEVTITVKEEYSNDVLVEEIVALPQLEHVFTDNANHNPLEVNPDEPIEEDNPLPAKRTVKRKQIISSKVIIAGRNEASPRTRRGKRRQTSKTQPLNDGSFQMTDIVEGPLSDEKSNEISETRSSTQENGNNTLENISPIRENDSELDNEICMDTLNTSMQNATHTDEEKLETKKDLYNCLLCDVPTYSTPNELSEHLKETHPDQIRVCEHCPKVFAAQSAFEHHQYCHATGRSHFCPFCDKGFQTEPLLKNHIRTHTHRSDYLCSLCGKEFNHKNNLRQHMIGHSGQKPWACSLCPCRFSTKGGLTIHQNTHTKIRAFSCDTCGSQFNKHYSLIKHKLIHTGTQELGERPFGCEICKMRFATNYMVKRHMRTHTGEKPYKCTYCERSFAQSNDMVKHMKMHVGSNPYQCDRCDSSFRLLTELRNHYKEHYQTGEHGAGSSTEEDTKGIRFTSLDILQLRYKKEMDQQQRGKPVESSDEPGTIIELSRDLSIEQYCIYEAVYKDGTLSMHTMMEKLVPSVFNAEQVKVDEYMCWPRKICEDCRGKVLEAYGLYEQCMRSGDLLRECLSRKPEPLIIENVYEDLKQGYTLETTMEVVSDFANHDEPTVLEQSPEREATPTGRRTGNRIKKERRSPKKMKSDIEEPRTPTPTVGFECDSDENDEQPLSSLVVSEKVTRKRSARNASVKSSTDAGGKQKRGKRGPGRKVKEPKEESSNEMEEPQTKVDIYRCLLCNAPTFSSPKEHTDHLKQEHPDQIHNCKLCPKVFMTKAAYEHHQYCHATGRSFFCIFCDKGFQTEQLLKNHMRTHTHGTGFLCSHCGQEFSNRSNLRQHLIRHTGEKPWQCSLCPSRFSMKSYLDRHQHTHTKAKFFSCDTCGSQFSRHYSLVKHQLIHTGDRHFTCEVCSMSTEEHCIYEDVYKDGTLSIHAMMEKLVPSVFNAEQVKVDEFMSFPTKICGGCKGKVLEAYGLYEQCVKSGDRLRECLARKKNATFIVNITGGGVDNTDAKLIVPLVECEEAPVVGTFRSNESLTTVVEITTEEIVPEDTPCKGEREGDEVLELVPSLSNNEDEHTASEHEDHQSCSGGENRTIRTSRAKSKKNEAKKPQTRAVTKRKRQIKREKASKRKQDASDDPLEEEEEEKPNVIKFRCLLCNGSTYSAPDDLTEHLKKDHAEQIECCNQCPKVFMTKAAFEHHQYCHATGRSFFCTFCDKGFQTEQLLKNHVRTHTHGTGFLCSQCGKEFSDRSNLRQHEHRHTGDKPWACSMCPSRFSTKGYLTVHLATHTKTKAFSCDTCGSQFNRRYSLVKHQVIHTGERHYACEVCQMRFASAYHVKIHMRTHTGEKPYKCGYCSRGFAQKNDMLKHIKTHGKPYPCDRCDASFQLIADLRIHAKEHDRARKNEETFGW
uniref:Zinc finger protein 865 n=1 Tax=Anopheles christyi TaxID=43041 RepID=A0A182JTB8_9DIPT